MNLDVVLVCFKGETTAASRFGAMRASVGGNEPWTHEVSIVEHLPNDRMSVRGTFAGHYVDVEELHHVSEPGAVAGALTGALVGAVFGPSGFAAGFVLGGAIGAVGATPTEVEPAPQPLVDDLRKAVPGGHSAIVLMAAPEHVDAMLSALGESGEATIRRSLSAERASAIIASVGAAPTASPSPSEQGDDVPAST